MGIRLVKSHPAAREQRDEPVAAAQPAAAAANSDAEREAKNARAQRGAEHDDHAQSEDALPAEFLVMYQADLAELGFPADIAAIPAVKEETPAGVPPGAEYREDYISVDDPVFDNPNYDDTPTGDPEHYANLAALLVHEHLHGLADQLGVMTNAADYHEGFAAGMALVEVGSAEWMVLPPHERIAAMQAVAYKYFEFRALGEDGQATQFKTYFVEAMAMFTAHPRLLGPLEGEDCRQCGPGFDESELVPYDVALQRR